MQTDTAGEKHNFFAWYFGQGIHELLELWKTSLLFFLTYFSIGELLMTLFSPWRRDVSIRDWRGFNPKRLIENLVGNIMSRGIGFIARVIVMMIGISVLFLTFVAGILLMFAWILFPLLASFLFYESVMNVLPFVFSGTFFGVWMLIIVGAYFADRQSSIYHLGFNAFYGHKLSQRLCQRFGIEGKKFPEGVLENEIALAGFLKQQNISKEEFVFVLKWEFEHEEKNRLSGKFWRWENLKKISSIGSQWKYGYTVNLDKYSTDLSIGDPTEYRKDDLIGRDNEMEVLNLILQRPDQNCVLLVGESGIGKKTMLHYFARMIRHNRSEVFFRDMRVLVLDLARAISDAINRGDDVENEMRKLFYEAAYAGNVLLVIEHFEHFLGKEGNVFHPDLSSVISEYLNVPSFQIIATSTPKEYHNLIEKESEISKYFEVIELGEPTEQQTIEILFSKMEKYEQENVIFTYGSLKEIVRASGKYNWQFPMPERAIDLAMDTFTYWNKKQDKFITEKTVDEYITIKTGIPQGEVQDDERKKLLNLEKLLHRHVIGQEDAVKQIAESLRRARSGISNTQKPMGSFMFVGPTGVGKTEMAKALARAYFGDEKKMIRFDMSEFQSPNSIDRLIGSSQLNQQGRLTNQVKDNPYSLILLDEIEKAYPEILNVFLQILDEGFVTDAFGQKINFRNSIIIATSNAGAPMIKDMVEQGIDDESIKQAIIDETVRTGTFRLEFLNRFNGVIFFKPLNSSELKSVVRLLLQKFTRRLSTEKNIDVEFNDNVVDSLIEKGYNPIFGARSIDHYMEQTIEDLVATKIISGEIKRGEKITVSL